MGKFCPLQMVKLIFVGSAKGDNHMHITSIELVLLVMAVWRLANLLANEDGPFHFFKTLRSRIARAEVRSRRKGGLLSKMHLYEGVNCEYCNSVWFGAFFAVVYLTVPPIALALALPLALSTGTIIIKKIVFVLGGIDTYLDKANNPPVPVRYPKSENGKGITLDWDGVYRQQIPEKGGNGHE